jgi:phosphoserine phosphatase
MKLRRRNWNAGNFKALTELLASVKPGELAVLDWDNTCAFNDIGEALLRHMTFGLEFRMDAAAMAAAIPDTIAGVGRVLLNGQPFSLQELKRTVFSAYGRLLRRPPRAEAGRRDDDFRVFASGLLALNRALEETPGIGCEFAYPWVNTLLQGLSPAELDELAAGVIARELRQPLRRRALVDPRRRWRYDWLDGVRIYPEMRELAACWRERGGRVVVSTASNRQLVERIVAMTGFPCHEIVGMELAVAKGRFTPRLKPGLQPNLGPGKAANLRARFRSEPALVAGDSSNDYEMLTAFPATRLRLVLDRRRPGRIARLVCRAISGETGYISQEIDLRRGTFKTAAR